MNDIFQTDLNKATLHFFRLSIAVTILSQIAEIESITRPIMYGCWLALLIDIVFLNRGRLRYESQAPSVFCGTGAESRPDIFRNRSSGS